MHYVPPTGLFGYQEARRATALALHIACVETPAGPMLVATDAQGRVRAVDWEEHEARLRGLLNSNYDRHAVTIIDGKPNGPDLRQVSCAPRREALASRR